MRIIIRILQAARETYREKRMAILFGVVICGAIVTPYGLLAVFGDVPELKIVVTAAAPLLLLACLAALVMWEDHL